MKIKVKNGKIQLHSLIKPIAIGHALGWGALMLPMLFLMIPMMLFVPYEGEENASPLGVILIMPFMFPVILIMQGIMFGCMATFGLWIFRSRGKIEIEDTND